jgi:hypothetical protein
MRRFVLFVAALTPIMLTAGCEDGPAQTYSPAPNGASTVWNGPPQAGGITGDGGVYVNPGTEAFDASFGGQTVNDTCTGPQKKAIWHNLFQEPIQIPGLAGGIDIAGGYNGDGSSGFVAGQPFNYDPTKETWSGTTVEQAEAILCQGAADSIYTGVTTTIGWGENAPAYELSAEYNANNRQITDLLFQYGYIGTINATSDDGSTVYSVGLNNLPIQVSVNGGTATNVILDWGSMGDLVATANQIYEAFRNTYAPTFPKDMDCYTAGHCELGNNGTEGGYIFITPLNLALFVNNTLAPGLAASTMGLVDLGLLKLLPFSLATTTMKLDAVGPLVSLPGIGGTGNTADCEYQLGQTFGMFNANCVEVFGSDTAQNTIAENKLFGGIGHTNESYQFDINGIDPQFSATLADNAVLGDTQRPVATDIAYQITVDQYTIGPFANDYTNNDINDPNGQDFHGIGLLTLEWANLVQNYIRANVDPALLPLGTPACIANPQTDHCSGIEGIVTTAPVASAPQFPFNALGTTQPAVTNVYSGGLKPATWGSTFCTDSTDASTCTTNYLFTQMQAQIASHYANPNSIPTILGSRRFYFQQWILALVKYLKVAGTPTATLAQVDAQFVDPNNLFFDSQGGGFEQGLYVERSTVNSDMQAPTAISVTTNLTTSVINDFQFSRYNFRGEKAIYTALTNTQGDLPGAEPVFLSNMVGAPVLAGAWGTYECATNTDPTNMDCGATPDAPTGATIAPVVSDATGTHPLFQGYEPAFGQTIFAIAPNGAAPIPSPITINPSGFELIASAQVTLPIYSPSTANPTMSTFDPTTWVDNPPTITVLVPYQPKGANVGFPVTIDGSRDKFYNTYNVDLTGTTVNGNVDYEYVNNTVDGGVVSSLVIRAIETQNYLGLVFACSNGNAGTSDEILSVRMYDNAETILNWIGEYPDAATSCGLQIKYSIYGNYPDYISFLNSGVRFGLNPGFGGSVVSDVTLFDSNVVGSLGQ